ncbi:unnamed protein product, partial [Cuscuta europaea]
MAHGMGPSDYDALSIQFGTLGMEPTIRNIPEDIMITLSTTRSMEVDRDDFHQVTTFRCETTTFGTIILKVVPGSRSTKLMESFQFTQSVLCSLPNVLKPIMVIEVGAFVYFMLENYDEVCSERHKNKNLLRELLEAVNSINEVGAHGMLSHGENIVVSQNHIKITGAVPINNMMQTHKDQDIHDLGTLLNN